MAELLTPDNYREKIDELTTGYSISLQEVVKLMPEYKLNAGNNANIRMSYLRNEDMLKQRMNDLENLKRNIGEDSTTLQSQIKRLNTMIELENAKHKLLNEQYNQLTNTDSAAKGALFDTQLLYNQQYIGNLLLLFVVFCYAKMIYSKYY